MTKASQLVAQLEIQVGQMEARLQKKDERLKTLSGHIQELKARICKLEAENNTLRERIRELEIVEESLGRNIADTAFCPLCLLKDCPQYHKGDLGMGAFDPESVDREQCKKSVLAHAEKGAKEFVNGQRTS